MAKHTELTASELILEVVRAAQQVEFYKTHGSHGDGKAKAAATRLAKAKFHAIGAINAGRR